MLDKETRKYIELNAFLNEDIMLEEDIGLISCPPLNEMDGGFMQYNYYSNMFLGEYEGRKDSFFEYIISNEQMRLTFIKMLTYYIKKAEISYGDEQERFYILSNKDRSSTIPIKERNVNEDLEHIQLNYIGKSNVSMIMDTIAILNWRNDSNKANSEMSPSVKAHMERVAEFKAKLKKNVENEDEGIGMTEIISSLCARHPSINLTNVKQLNYFQIIEQFHRLQMLDSYEISSNAFTSGTLGEQGMKDFQKKHYTNKIELK